MKKMKKIEKMVRMFSGADEMEKQFANDGMLMVMNLQPWLIS